MSWTEVLYRYCERGTDPTLFAEPVNVLTSAAFFATAALAWRKLMSLPSAVRDIDCKIFVALIAMMGVGSTIFHLFGQRWSYFADVTPITIFILVYLNFALNRYLAIPPGVSFLATVAYALTAPAISALPGGGLQLMNGSVGFVPALCVLAAVAWTAHSRGHPAGRDLLLATGIFFVALTLRTVDRAVCDLATIGGHATGTHGLWHLLNAWVLYLLVTAAMDHGRHGEKTYEVLPPTGRTDEA
ncbi:MAG: ceramidase domain-containing protein [Hyphomicrobiaceae bacterium]